MSMEGEFSRYLEDVYSAEPVEREALSDECDVLVVGAGFAGLLLWHKLRGGVITDQCVESAIRDACDLGYLVTQVSDACLTYSAQRHAQSLRTIQGYCRQVTTQQLVAEIANIRS